MPLSEHEQRIFEQLERQLREEDPQLAARVGGRPTGVRPRRLPLGVSLAVLGLAVVVAGVGLQLVALGVAGAVLMGAGLLLATDARRPSGGEATPAASSDGVAGPHRRQTRPGRGRPRRDAWMRRLEQQWEERRSEGL